MESEINIPKVEATSLDVTATEKEKLKAVFPECFNEGKLDIDKLLSLCGEFIDNDFEKYNFEWNGKSACYRTIATPTLATLRPYPEESVDFDKTNNLYIEGDNLEVLKILQKAYFRKVKMIYIDPPYNTGNDFVYEDDFKDPLAKYKEVTSQTTKSNPETMGRYHTNWLNMMYPRLRLAANLLRDDGVIFISIDDNEVTNLHRLCDEVFGEENFVGELIWRKKTGASDANGFAIITEYILVYVKNKTDVNKIFSKDKTGFDTSRYRLSDEYENRRGKHYIDNLDRGSLQYSDSLNYGITCPDGKIIFPNDRTEYKNDGWIWTWSKQKFEWGVQNGFIVFRKNPAKKTGWTVCRKNYLYVDKDDNIIEKSNPYKNLIVDILNTNATKELSELFNGKLFDYPKPTELIKRFLNYIQFNQDDIILDFFSGSATTAHAVMQLNAEDGGNRQFIMVQLPELCDEKSEAFKAGYKNICEIGKERIRRVGAKIKGQNSSSLLETAREIPLDTGFKVFKLDSSNLIAWDSSPIETGDTETLFNRYEQWSDRIKKDRSQKDLVYEIMLKLGIPLTYPVTEERINGRLVHIIGEDCLVAVCLDGTNGGIQPEDIEALCDKCPAKIVASEDAFADNVTLANAHYIVEDKHVELMLI